MSNLVQTHYPFPDKISTIHTHASFLAMWSRVTPNEGNPYAKVIMIVRADGSYGFPGGKMEERDGMNILENAAREAYEEVGARRDISSTVIDIPPHYRVQEVKYLGACLCKDSFYTHFCAVEIQLSKLHDILKNASHASDFYDECAGVVAFNWTPAVVRKLLDHSALALSVREEIYQLSAMLAIEGLFN